MDSTERWVSSKEVSEHLGINKDTLQRWIKNGTVPCHRVGRLWKFRISEIDNWVENGGAAKADDKYDENQFDLGGEL